MPSRSKRHPLKQLWQTPGCAFKTRFLTAPREPTLVPPSLQTISCPAQTMQHTQLSKQNLCLHAARGRHHAKCYGATPPRNPQTDAQEVYKPPWMTFSKELCSRGEPSRGVGSFWPWAPSPSMTCIAMQQHAVYPWCPAPPVTHPLPLSTAMTLIDTQQSRQQVLCTPLAACPAMEPAAQARRQGAHRMLLDCFASLC